MFSTMTDINLPAAKTAAERLVRLLSRPEPGKALERRHNIGRGSLIILDAVVPTLIASERHQSLVNEAGRCGWEHFCLGQRPEENRVYLCQQVAMSDASPSGKNLLTDWWGCMQVQNKQWNADFYEGLVAKRADALYPIQLRSPKAE